MVIIIMSSHPPQGTDKICENLSRENNHPCQDSNWVLPEYTHMPEILLLQPTYLVS
jgi:hypothetical protein